MRAAPLAQYCQDFSIETADPAITSPNDVIVCGHETAGWIAEVGVGVTNVSVGEAVLLHPLATCGYCKACRAADDMRCVAVIEEFVIVG